MNGDWIGGTGRFEQAYGVWSGTYAGFNFDPVSGYKTITGAIEGTLFLQ